MINKILKYFFGGIVEDDDDYEIKKARYKELGLWSKEDEII